MRQDAVRPLAVLSGRCSERETVAFQAVDAIVEQLAEQLMELGHRQGGISAYAEAATQASQAFPLLNRLRVSSGEATVAVGDPLARRLLAFRGIRVLFHEVSRWSRIVVCIDDWQWADADSVALLWLF